MNEQDAWLGEVGEAMARRIARAAARPDFHDVVARAHELDAVAWPREAVHEAGALELEHAPQVELGSAREEAAVDEWLHDVRSAVERRVEARRHEGLPPLAAPAGKRGAWWIAGALLAAAALLVLGIGQGVRMVADGGLASEQALHMSDAPGSTGTSEVIEPPPQPTMRRRPEAVSRGAAALEPAEPELAEPELAATPTVEGGPRLAPVGGDRWKALAEEAQAHWRAGRHAQAERLFAKIAAQAGRARAAELAYADLFTLASQAGDEVAQRRWWKAYVRRFPRGRFADDARAGLCRSAGPADRVACWQAYVDEFPQGSFRGEARAQLERGAP